MNNRACTTYDCIRAGTIEVDQLIATNISAREITVECDLVVPCNLFVGEDAFIGRNVNIANELEVNGETTLNSTVRVNSNLLVTGNTNLQNVTVFGNASLQGITTIEQGGVAMHDGTLFINGDFVIDSTGLFEINRRADFTAGFDAEQTSTAVNLIVTGNFNSGTPSTPGSATFFGGVTFLGPVTFAQCPTFPSGCSFPLSTV